MDTPGMVNLLYGLGLRAPLTDIRICMDLAGQRLLKEPEDGQKLANPDTQPPG